MRILVCGDRNWFKISYIKEVLSWFDPRSDIIIHGCARGADTLAGRSAKELGWPKERIEEYPAHWSHTKACPVDCVRIEGNYAGNVRNTQMLEEGQPDIVFAFHSDLAASKGTKDMVKKSCKKGLPVLHYE